MQRSIKVCFFGILSIGTSSAARLRLRQPTSGLPDGYTPLVYPPEWDRAGVPKTFTNDHHTISYLDSVTHRRKSYKKTDGDACRECCQYGGYHHPNTICAFEGIEPSLDECDRKCGDLYDLTEKDQKEGEVWSSLLQTRARVQSKSKIVHEVFSSLAERRSKEAEKARSVADQASAALAQLHQKRDGQALSGGRVLKASEISQIEKALEAAQTEQSSETVAAQEAANSDRKQATQAGKLERKMEHAMQKAEAAANRLDRWTGAEALPITPKRK